MSTTNSAQPQNLTLTQLQAGMQLLHSGDQVYTVAHNLAEQFQAGDKLLFVSGNSDPIIIPKFATELVADKIKASQTAFYHLADVSDDQLNLFYDTFSENLANDTIWESIKMVNIQDVEIAKKRGRSTTRLIASDKTRQNMIAGLLEYKNQPIKRVETIANKQHDGWSVELKKSPLGIVGFVFEGRPNVIADATGVLKSGNTAIFRVGQDALLTANAILDHALYPALDAAKIKRDVIQILNRPERATAWALFSNPDLNLAVARGSGPAVEMLGNIAQQAGVAVSLHGTGGAWMVTSKHTNPEDLTHAIIGSLDRKVCNTLNTLCVVKSELKTQLPALLKGLQAAATKLNTNYRLHVEKNSAKLLNELDYSKTITVQRPAGPQTEPQVSICDKSQLGHEFMWEQSPEICLMVVENVQEAITLCNHYSPQFVASIITSNKDELSQFFNSINAPFVGNGMTRWVDGQYALHAPELGLSNWENGRFLARSAILSGDGVYTTRIQMDQTKTLLTR